MAVNEPEARGVALAMQTVLDDVGKGMGPALVAALITAFHSRCACFNPPHPCTPLFELVQGVRALLCAPPSRAGLVGYLQTIHVRFSAQPS